MVSEQGLRLLEQQIRFCKTSDNVRIAYATAGKGQPLVRAAGWLTHLHFDLDGLVWRHWTRELSRFHQYVRYDERGSGLSDWEVNDFSFNAWVRDLETVTDSVGLEKFALLGIGQGAAVSIAYAIRHPERVSRLILYGGYAKGWNRRSLPREELEEMEARVTLMKKGWGKDNPSARMLAAAWMPEASLETIQEFSKLQRVSTSPENAIRFVIEFGNIDVYDLLPKVSVPTLILHNRDDPIDSLELGRELAKFIPNSRFVPLEGKDFTLPEGSIGWKKFLREVHSFLGVEEAESEPLGGIRGMGLKDWLRGPKTK